SLQLLIREMILQLKRGYLQVDYFRQKFQVDVVAQWSAVWQSYVNAGLVQLATDRVELTRAGLLQVDGMLPAFFEAQFQGVRYT
ncbi:MAG: coproporphyrinogen III oxidase, partial [Planctomycetota bacterium]